MFGRGSAIGVATSHPDDDEGEEPPIATNDFLSHRKQKDGMTHNQDPERIEAYTSGTVQDLRDDHPPTDRFERIRHCMISSTEDVEAEQGSRTDVALCEYERLRGLYESDQDCSELWIDRIATGKDVN